MKKGHWPKGKRRKPDTGARIVGPLRRSVTRRGLVVTAHLLGVSARTVGRWLKAERFPSPEEVRRIRELDN